MPSKRNKRTVAPLVVGIGSSPRRGGNTDILLDSALEGARSAGASVAKIVLNDIVFKPCQACGGCGRTGLCVIRDGMGRIYKSVQDADAIIVASPVYFGSVTAQLKAMIDRFQSRWAANTISASRISARPGRKGFFISAAGSDDRKVFLHAAKVVRNFLATVNAAYSGGLFCGGVEDKGAIAKDRNAVKKAFQLGRRSVSARYR